MGGADYYRRCRQLMGRSTLLTLLPELLVLLPDIDKQQVGCLCCSLTQTSKRWGARAALRHRQASGGLLVMILDTHKQKVGCSCCSLTQTSNRWAARAAPRHRLVKGGLLVLLLDTDKRAAARHRQATYVLLVLLLDTQAVGGLLLLLPDTCK